MGDIRMGLVQTFAVILDAAQQERDVSVVVARKLAPRRKLIIRPSLKYQRKWYLCGSIGGRHVSIPLSSIHRAEII